MKIIITGVSDNAWAGKWYDGFSALPKDTFVHVSINRDNFNTAWYDNVWTIVGVPIRVIDYTGLIRRKRWCPRIASGCILTLRTLVTGCSVFKGDRLVLTKDSVPVPPKCTPQEIGRGLGWSEPPEWMRPRVTCGGAVLDGQTG
jgi:hypothetical protein